MVLMRDHFRAVPPDIMDMELRFALAREKQRERERERERGGEKEEEEEENERERKRGNALEIRSDLSINRNSRIESSSCVTRLHENVIDA